MISEDRQDLAALYVLGSLEAKERSEFEGALQDDAELRDLVNDLRESAAALAFATPDRQPPTVLKQRILRQIAVEKSGGGLTTRARTTSWMPWAIAASFMVFCGVLVYDRAHMRRELEEVRARDPLAQMNFVTLMPQKDGPAAAKAMVAWQPSEQTGVIRVTGLPVVAGKDYQLWAVDADHKDPV